MSANGRKIVVGVDGSEHSDRALAWASGGGQLREARLQVVSAWHVPAHVYGAPASRHRSAPTSTKPSEMPPSESATAAAQIARDAGVEADVDVDQGQTVEAARGSRRRRHARGRLTWTRRLQRADARIRERAVRSSRSVPDRHRPARRRRLSESRQTLGATPRRPPKRGACVPRGS